MLPRLCCKMQSIKIFAEGRDQRSESYVFIAAAQGAPYTYTYVVYIRTCDMYISSSSSCDGAAHVLSTLVHAICTTFIIYSKQQLLRSYLSTQLRCELWVIASRYTYSHRFCKQTEQQYHSCQQLSRLLWDLHPYTHPSTFSHNHPPPASRHNRWTP